MTSSGCPPLSFLRLTSMGLNHMEHLVPSSLPGPFGKKADRQNFRMKLHNKSSKFSLEPLLPIVGRH